MQKNVPTTKARQFKTQRAIRIARVRLRPGSTPAFRSETAKQRVSMSVPDWWVREKKTAARSIGQMTTISSRATHTPVPGVPRNVVPSGRRRILTSRSRTIRFPTLRPVLPSRRPLLIATRINSGIQKTAEFAPARNPSATPGT
jgi:hypothetical protein